MLLKTDILCRGRAYAGRKIDVGGGVSLLNTITGAGMYQQDLL